MSTNLAYVIHFPSVLSKPITRFETANMQSRAALQVTKVTEIWQTSGEVSKKVGESKIKKFA